MSSPRHTRRGTSLIEVLVGMTILALVMIGILQMFSLALLTDFGSSARTELTGKCQQVVENLRLAQFYANQGNTALATAVGLPVPLAVTASPVLLPYTAAELSAAPYWGPTQSSVVEGPDLPYRLSYVIAQNPDPNAPAGYLLVTVTATAVGNATVASAQSAGNANSRLYMGMSKRKRVDYVAYLQ